MENGLTFGVEKVPLQKLGVSLAPKSGISHAIITKNEILSFCSGDYSLIPNKEIIDSFTQALNDGNYRFELKWRAFNRVRFQMSFVFKTRKKTVRVGDTVAPEIRVFNSYDGSVRYGFQIGVHRLICSNGLTTLESGDKINMLHTLSAGDGEAIRRSIALIDSFRGTFEENLEIYEELASYRVNPRIRVDEILENTHYPKNLVEIAIEQINTEAVILKAPPTDWAVYNGLNYALQNADNLLGRKADKLDREVLNYIYNN